MLFISSGTKGEQFWTERIGNEDDINWMMKITGKFNSFIKFNTAG